ncbi:MAG: hypothetical protein J6X51_00885 [Bacteroidales bacterium]|nr:hypothetical protein [Bacteroidales bacterium]
MKKISVILCLSIILLMSFSCKRECVCTGYHPVTAAADEEHSYGKMTTGDCQDKQYQMNNDTTFTTNKLWVCKN